MFEQGEGPVNTLGGMFGKDKIIQLNMTTAGVFKIDKKGKITIMNWNGSPSPAVHQYDRFSALYFGDANGMGSLSAFEGFSA